MNNAIAANQNQHTAKKRYNQCKTHTKDATRKGKRGKKENKERGKARATKTNT